MILKYILRQEVGQTYISTDIPKLGQEFCCKVMEAHVSNDDVYLNHKRGMLEVESYDHDVLDIRYCFNCGQKLEFECLGKQWMKRDDYGTLIIKVGQLEELIAR